jgi:hypothetical protein
MKYHMSLHWRITWGRRRVEQEPGSPSDSRASTPFSEPQDDDSPEPAQASSSQPAQAIDYALSASTAAAIQATTTDFHPLRLCESEEDAKRVSAARVAAGKALPVCLVTRLRATMGLDESTDGSVYSADDA